ncbi:DoxX family membrane protein [Frigidibacter sp.]|uniref:DoxX family membrane protein n=1 Tax=Frigidibacter sp. TaxID=2586418 RepID=UPI002734BCD8|nr:DoxX family membrane protein [Frigidibacter sp.]MDP3339646.1 DoxX family membrane protein [Frigidibacter sp.]
MPEFSDVLAYAALSLGRLLLGGYFVASGLRHLAMRDRIAADLVARGMPQPMTLAMAAAGFQIVLGALLGLGLMVTLPALLLALFTGAVSAGMLNFWTMAEPERDAAQAAFLGNVAVVGGLILAAATPWVRFG